MADIIRNRTIRPSNRLESSKNYKVDTRFVDRDDVLIVNIKHESSPFSKTYRFNGSDVADKNSISFRVTNYGSSTDISWSGATPIGTVSSPPVIISKASVYKHSQIGLMSHPNTQLHSKNSFSPVENENSEILILGTMPGDKSIEIGEYYCHPRNRFWSIISTITDNSLPSNYVNKVELLERMGIALWDVARSATRRGSLDDAIKDEEPNDLVDFVRSHRKLRIIAFNGAKSQTLYDKHFNRNHEIQYVLLPSSSPANTSITLDKICRVWHQKLFEIDNGIPN